MRLFACVAVACVVKFNCTLGRIAPVLAAVAWALRPRAGPPLAPVRRALGAAACDAEPDAVEFGEAGCA